VLREFLTSRNWRREHWQGGTEAARFFEPTRSILAKRNGAVSSAAQFTKPWAEMRLSLRTSRSMTQNANVIGRNVARFRYQKGWSQDLFVTKMQLLGFYITRDILANIETLRTIATDKQIVVFAEVFGVPVGDLFPPKQKSSGRIVGLNR